MKKFAIGAAAALLAVDSALGCYLADTDYRGNDIDRLEGKVYSPRECQRLCQGLAACELWTYQPATNTCYLKGGGGAASPASGLISGPRICPGPVDCSKEGIDLYGSDLINTRVANALACQYQCSAVSGCAFWTFVTSTSRCYLKGSRVEPRPLAGAISGPRSCPSAPTIPCEQSTDFNGHDIRSFLGTVTDVDRCQQLCLGFNNCFYWTYVASTASCYLKDSNATDGREVNPLAFSGARDCDISITTNPPITTTTTTPPPSDCLLYNVDFQGADVYAFGLGFVTKPEACQLICQYTPVCHFFTFYDGTCFFKGADAPQYITEKQGAVSGPKRCGVQIPGISSTTTTPPPTTLDAYQPSALPEDGIFKLFRTHGRT